MIYFIFTLTLETCFYSRSYQGTSLASTIPRSRLDGILFMHRILYRHMIQYAEALHLPRYVILLCVIFYYTQFIFDNTSIIDTDLPDRFVFWSWASHSAQKSKFGA